MQNLKNLVFKRLIYLNVLLISIITCLFINSCSDVGAPHVDINAHPSRITKGETVTLIWHSNGADLVSIDNGLGNRSPDGSVFVTPTVDTKYTITGVNEDGKDIDSVIVYVEDCPEISLSVDKDTIIKGDEITLTWEITNADAAYLKIGNSEKIKLDNKTQKKYSPTQTTVYLLIAEKDECVRQEQVIVNVQNPTGNNSFIKDNALKYDMVSSSRIINNSKFISKKLPLSIDHSELIPEVKDQGFTGSCTAWALAYYLKTYQEAVEMKWDKNQNAFSPMYVFTRQCKLFEKPWDMVKAWEILANYGTVKMNEMPFTTKIGYLDSEEKLQYSLVIIDEELNEKAREYRSGNIFTLSSLDEVKNALTLMPVALALNNFSFSYPPNPASPENNFMFYEQKNSDIKHTVICVGYDDAKFGNGALKFVNSWGIDWGIDGFSWIKYSDYDKIVEYAMAVNDINNIQEIKTTDGTPPCPMQVNASDNIGPYVDITWDKVLTALYYRIYRKPADSSYEIDYEPIGISYNTNYRDIPSPDMTYLYAVASVNEFGESEHFDIDDDKLLYVDKGSANADNLPAPKLSWKDNGLKGEVSNFEVDFNKISPTALGIYISVSKEGPYQSLGLIQPAESFSINWTKNSKYIGKNPYVKINSMTAEGISDFSNPIHVVDTILPHLELATVSNFQGSSINEYINLSWLINGDNIDFIEIWRSQFEKNNTNGWHKIAYVSKDITNYQDNSVIPGFSYFYEIVVIYNSCSSIPYKIKDHVGIKLVKPNLYINNVNAVKNDDNKTFNFDITILNNGSTDIEDYKLNIQAFNWDKNEIIQIDSRHASDFENILLPLVQDNEHQLIFDVDVSSMLTNGYKYSWRILVDSDSQLDEAYEKDNKFWFSDVFTVNISE